MKTPKRDKSNSSPQLVVEKIIREQLAKPLNWPGTLESRLLSYGNGGMEFDCYGEHNGTVLLAEINAHHGKLKGGQLDKVLGDILKMYAQSVELKQTGVKSIRMAMIFTNEEAAKYIKGRSWAAEAARKFGIEPHVVPLDAKQIKILLKAQKDQDVRDS